MLDQKLIISKLEEAVETKGQSIAKYMGTSAYSDLMEFQVSIKVDGGEIQYVSLKEALGYKAKGNEVTYLAPKPVTQAVIETIVEDAPQVKTQDVKQEEISLPENTDSTPTVKEEEAKLPEVVDANQNTESLEANLEKEEEKTDVIKTEEAPLEETKAPEVKQFIKK